MILIVGLGNPGKKYEATRHNLGFAVLDALLQELTPVKKTVWQEDKKSNSLIAKVGDLILVKPLTFVNASGFAVRKLITNYPFRRNLAKRASPITNLWVIHDDLDLPLGKIKIRKGGASAGHRGIDSIVKELETPDFVRFRLGIGHPRRNWKLETRNSKLVEGYVLSPFGRGEKDETRKMVKKTVKAIRLALEKGLEEAMNKYNP